MTERFALLRFAPVLPFCLITLLAVGSAVAQQGLFAPRLIVNDRAITGYELQQRTQFLTLLRAPGDPAELARDGLIEDRLRAAAAKQAGIVLSPEQVQAGMEEFASRADLTAEQFVVALEQGGVSAQSFRDFVEAGLLWREVVRARFAGQVSVSEIEIDRAITYASAGTARRFLLSEIVIAAPGGNIGAAMAEARRVKREIKTEADFAAAARRVSTAPSAAQGGRLDPVPLSALPEAVVPLVRAVPEGQMSDPMSVPGGVVIYFKRGVEEAEVATGGEVFVDYAEFLLPEGAGAGADIARVRAAVDTCNDLYGAAQGLSPERLTRVTRAQSQVPGDVAAELQRLDPGESSAALVRGGWRVFLMLCDRSTLLQALPDRVDVRQTLINQKLNALAELYLQDLRATALIREP